jgi:hypothetical protein
MALPLIFLPAEIPLPLIAGFGISLGEQFDHVPALQGEGRKRRMFTTAPRTVQVSWLLTARQMQVFNAWAERDLDVLTNRFTIKLQRLGVGFEYWAAEWVRPYSADPIASPDGLWRVAGQLLLTGEPADSPPSTGALEGATTVSLGGSGVLNVPNALEGVTIVSLGAFIALQGLTEIVLGYFLPYDPGGNELRDDDGIELREDGGNELRE